MKKLFVFGVIFSLVPMLCVAENAKISKLMKEKQSKMEQLEKCMGSTKGLKIAGISTLGLTAVGVAGNIAEASAIKKYNEQIEATDKKIEKTQAEIEEKQAAKLAKEQAEQKRLAAVEEAKRQKNMLGNVARADINAINNAGDIGSKAVSHGYMPERLPDNLRNQFANAMVSFIAKCRSLIGTNGISDVSLTPSIQENWRQYLGQNPLSEDYVLPDLNEHIIAECKVTACNLTTHDIETSFDGYMVCSAKRSQNPQGNTNVQGNQTGTTPTDTTPSQDAGNNNGDASQPQQGADGVREGLSNIIPGAGDQTTVTPAQNTVATATTPVVKKAKDWTDAEKEANPDGFCKQAYSSASGKACCMEIYSGKRASRWDVSAKTCICNNGLTWNNNACTSQTSSSGTVASAGSVAGAESIGDEDLSSNPPEPVSVFQDVQLGSLDQCRSLVSLYAKEKGLILTYKSHEERSKQDFLSYEGSDKQKYIFEFDDCDDSFPSLHRENVAKALCTIYNGSPTNRVQGIECVINKSAASINSDLASFNSNYTYGVFSYRRCNSQNMGCTDPTATGFTWKK